MPAAASSETARLTLDSDLWKAVDAVRAITGGTRSDIVTKALKVYFDLMPRLEQAIDGIENAYGDKNAIGILADTCIAGLEAMKENEALRREIGRAHV